MTNVENRQTGNCGCTNCTCESCACTKAKETCAPSCGCKSK